MHHDQRGRRVRPFLNRIPENGWGQTSGGRIGSPCWVALCFVAVVLGCARAPLKSDKDLMRLGKTPEVVADDLGYRDLLEALNQNIIHLSKGRAPLMFGEVKVERSFYLEQIQALKKSLQEDPTGALFQAELRKRFEFREVYGEREWGDVLVTSYFTPLLLGSPLRTEQHSSPLYALPEDLVTVDLDAYRELLPEWLSGANSPKSIRGRLVYENGKPSKVVPYFSRDEVDEEVSLRGRGLEIAWVDPIDAFFLQIQGSGMVRFEDGREIYVGYAGQNGHQYVAIGRYLLDVIPKEKMSMQAIVSHLRSLSPEEKNELLFKNPSYVFFRELPGRPMTSSGATVHSGRTIATDRTLFPKLTMAYLEFEKPQFDSSESFEPSSWVKVSRFVFDQDTGGAIKGPGHIDLYWGEGPGALQAAGVMRGRGRLYYLVPR